MLRKIESDGRGRGGMTDGQIQHEFTPSAGFLRLFISANKLNCKPGAGEQSLRA